MFGLLRLILIVIGFENTWLYQFSRKQRGTIGFFMYKIKGKLVGYHAQVIKIKVLLFVGKFKRAIVVVHVQLVIVSVVFVYSFLLSFLFPNVLLLLLLFVFQ